MRQIDEITERPAPRPLPAPSGPRSPTGPVPLIASAIPPPVDDAPLVPYLPAVAPKTSTTTGQVPTTASLAATLGIADPSPVQAPPPKPKRNFKRARKPLVVLAILLVVVLLLGVIFRHTALVERFTGSGYDSNPLPTHSVPMPEIAGADFTYTFESIVVPAGGGPSHLSQTDHDEVDFSAGIAKLSINSEVVQIVAGKIGPPNAPSTPKELFVDKVATYQRGAADTDPWVRTPLVPGSRADTILNRADIRMYQDVVDPALRAQVPVSIVDEARHDVAVTTYTYEFAFGDFYESAPRLFEWTRSMEGNAADDANVTVTISLDEQMLVRYLDVNLDYAAVIEHVGDNNDVGGTYRYRSTFEVNSTAGAAAALAIPTNVVDPTTTTVPTFDTTPAVPVTP